MTTSAATPNTTAPETRARIAAFLPKRRSRWAQSFSNRASAVGTATATVKCEQPIKSTKRLRLFLVAERPVRDLLFLQLPRLLRHNVVKRLVRDLLFLRLPRLFRHNVVKTRARPASLAAPAAQRG